MNENLRKWNKSLEEWFLKQPILYSLVYAVFFTALMNFIRDGEIEISVLVIDFVLFFVIGIGSYYFFRYIIKKYP